jgi:uncharacterized membrane protein
MLKREITISERIELHLFWFESIIFIKPLPAWMLDWDFCNAHICTDRDLYELVNGWLRSYTKLIQYPSDFVIAKKLGLLPKRIRTWDEWSDLSIALQMRIDNSIVNKRYYYGELRLRRLNHIYLFLRAFDTYHYIHQRHKPFFSEKFGRLLLFLVYLTTILSVLQVVVSTQHTPEKLGDFSYWFGLVSVAIIFFFVVVQLLLFVMNFLWHFVATVNNHHRKEVDWKFHSKFMPMRVKDFRMGRKVGPGTV